MWTHNIEHKLAEYLKYYSRQYAVLGICCMFKFYAFDGVRYMKLSTKSMLEILNIENIPHIENIQSILFNYQTKIYEVQYTDIDGYTDQTIYTQKLFQLDPIINLVDSVDPMFLNIINDNTLQNTLCDIGYFFINEDFFYFLRCSNVLYPSYYIIKVVPKVY